MWVAVGKVYLWLLAKLTTFPRTYEVITLESQVFDSIYIDKLISLQYFICHIL